MTTLLRTEALSKRVTSGEGELTLLDNISFELHSGESLAIVGASGSGKTTLLGLLAGLDRPTQGEVFWDGMPTSAMDEDRLASERQRRIGFVFQSFQLLPALSALENVMLPLDLMSIADSKSRALEWLGRVGLAARTSHLPRQLSGGEQQRVAIARAFVTGPKLVLADEPTGNLDTATGESIVNLMFDLNAQSSTTLILVTHDVKLAARCSRQIRLDSGRMVGA